MAALQQIRSVCSKRAIRCSGYFPWKADNYGTKANGNQWKICLICLSHCWILCLEARKKSCREKLINWRLCYLLDKVAGPALRRWDIVKPMTAMSVIYKICCIIVTRLLKKSNFSWQLEMNRRLVNIANWKIQFSTASWDFGCVVSLLLSYWLARRITERWWGICWVVWVGRLAVE